MKIQLCCIKDNDVTKCGDIVEVDLTENGVVFPDNEIYSLDWLEQTHTAIPLVQMYNAGYEIPLTEKDLRNLIGKPVYVVSNGKGCWYVIHSVSWNELVGGYCTMTNRGGSKKQFLCRDIGTSWAAYRTTHFDSAAGGLLKTDDFGALCNCAVRYALGRRSYMPYLVCRYLKKILRNLNWKTIGCMERDIREADKFGGYGDNCDYQEWMGLLGEIRNYMDQNGIQRWP